MKLTEKSTQPEVETTEIVCEITQDEFSQLCTETAASITTKFIGDNPSIDELMAGLALTHILAGFTADLEVKLFHDKDTNENPDKKEEK
jgi:hypothetical protein